jgi:hypothetical protein
VGFDHRIRPAASAGSGGPNGPPGAAARARRQIPRGSPWGRTGDNAGQAVRSGDQGAEALGQVDIMSVMSSEEREGFWQAGCRYLQPA